MANNKIEVYYKLKKDIESLDKFVNNYFISLERKDKTVNSNFEFRFSSLKDVGKQVVFEDINMFCSLLNSAFVDMKLELLNRTLEKMKKKLSELKEEIKIECNKFLQNECESN